MSNRLAVTVASLSGIGLMVWLALEMADRPHDPSGDDRAPSAVDSAAPDTGGEGSALPCDVPLVWRLGDVDAEFGLTTDEVREAIEEAAHLWEEGVGRALFERHPEDGFPIRLVYDERQERTQERQRLVTRFEREDRELRERFEDLGARGDRLDDRVADHEGAVRDLEEKLRDFEEEVETWNERGGAPPDVQEELEGRREELVEIQDSLLHQESELEGSRQDLEAERERLDRRLDELSREAGELEEAFPTERVRSGRYAETVATEDGEAVSADREILIHRFDDGRDLVRVAAHELGHALGLGHAREDGALMGPTYDREDVAAGGPVVSAVDVELFRETCPELAGPGEL